MDKDQIAEFYRRWFPDSVLVETDSGLLHMPKPGHLHCDFCSGETVVRRYECESFVADLGVMEVEAGSEGDWAACHQCALLIDSDQREELAKRVARSIAKRYGLPYDEVLPDVRRLHRGFWKHRKKK